MNNKERLRLIREAKQSGYTGSYTDLFDKHRQSNNSTSNKNPSNIVSNIDPEKVERLQKTIQRGAPQRERNTKEGMESIINTVKKDLYNNPVFNQIYNDTNFNIKVADSDRASKKPASWLGHTQFWDAEEHNSEIEHPDPGKDVVELFINSDAYHNSDMTPEELRSMILGDVLEGLTEKDPSAKELKSKIWDSFPPIAKDNLKERIYPESRKSEKQSLEDFISTDFLDGYVRSIVPDGTNAIQQSYQGNDRGFYRDKDLKKYYQKAYNMNPELKENIKDVESYLGYPFKNNNSSATAINTGNEWADNKFEKGGLVKSMNSIYKSGDFSKQNISNTFKPVKFENGGLTDPQSPGKKAMKAPTNILSSAAQVGKMAVLQKIYPDISAENLIEHHNKQIKDKQEFETYKKGLAWVESTGGKYMINSKSTATGLYQQRFSEIKDIYDGTREEFSKDIDAQNDYLEQRYYGTGFYKKQNPHSVGMKQDGQELYDEYKSQITDFKYSASDLSVLVNILGRQGTRNYLGYVVRDGKSLSDSVPSAYGPNSPSNKTPDEYLKVFQEGVDRE